MANSTEVSAPVVKSVAALGAGVGTSVLSVTQQAQSFLPKDLSGWIAVAASTVALIYTLHLLCDFYWRKFWRPLAERKGWVKKTRHTRRWNDVEEDPE